MLIHSKGFLALCVSSLLLISGCGSNSSSSNAKVQPSAGSIGDGKITTILQKKIQKYDIPAMAVLVVDENGTLEKAYNGYKTYGGGRKILPEELWNIGSLTKSMTATLSAKMVEQGYLDWNTTLLEVFPEFSSSMQEQYKNVTLIELLSHTSGLPADNDSVWEEFIDDNRTLIEQRYEVCEGALAFESQHQKGEYLYSNINYVVTAAILEKKSSKVYESLMKEYLFDPLGMDSSQFGSNGLENNAYGHKVLNQQLIAIEPSEITADNVAVVAPAGSQTFISLDDMSKYLQEHLKANMGLGSEYLSAESFSRLHTKVVNVDEDLGYSLGWFSEAEYGLQHSEKSRKSSAKPK
ncbi:MAG TPA: class A beta-lactamase-related serine hydrolase [Epsilonproteobacteria bacterium]|nr:class A beta-lactamase-related serine hydrolase [Campylobacterota bacterium]